jgi:hypothetical protein
LYTAKRFLSPSHYAHLIGFALADPAFCILAHLPPAFNEARMKLNECPWNLKVPGCQVAEGEKFQHFISEVMLAE